MAFGRAINIKRNGRRSRNIGTIIFYNSTSKFVYVAFLCKIHSTYSHGWTARGPTEQSHKPTEQAQMDKTIIQLTSTGDETSIYR